MADKKISALTAATTPLAGTEVLPIVQSGATTKVSVANLTAGRAVSMLSGTVTDNIATPVGFNINNNSANVAAGTRVNWQFNGSTVGYVGNQFDGADFNNLYNTNRFHIFTVGGTQFLKIDNPNVTVTSGNLVIGTSGKGIDFSATPGTGTSELLADYEEGTWSPVVTSTTGSITSYTSSGTYTKVGRLVYVSMSITITNNGTGAGALRATLPFTSGVVSTSLGREANSTGTAVQVVTYAASTTVDILSLSNTYPALTGYGFLIGFSYSV